MTDFDNHVNFGRARVAVAPSPPDSGTTLSLAAGQGAWLPAAPSRLVVAPDGEIPSRDNAEIIGLAARSGDDLTITRMAEPGSVAARAIQAGDVVFYATTAGLLEAIEAATQPTAVADGDYGSGSDALIATVLDGRITDLATEGIVAKKFGGIWGWMHSYGGGPSGIADAHDSFWRRFGAIMNIPPSEMNVYTRGGALGGIPGSDDLASQIAAFGQFGVGDIFALGYPEHRYEESIAPLSSQHPVAPPSVDMLLIGLNDATNQGGDLLAGLSNTRRLAAFKHAMRAVLGVRRTGRVYGINDSAVSFVGAGWATKTDKDYVLDGRYKETGTLDEYVQLALPPTYGGEPVIVEVLAMQNFGTTLGAGGIASGVSTTVPIADNTLAPQAGSYELLVGSEIILVDAQAGTGAKTLAVHGGAAGRGQRGTVAAAHASGVVGRPTTTAYLDLASSSASCSSQQNVAPQIAEKTFIAGQGSAGFDIQLHQRIPGLTSADAGKNVRVRLKAPGGLGAAADALRFVCFRIEDPEPNTMFAIDQPIFDYGAPSGLAVAQLPALNAIWGELAAEVSDAGNVIVVGMAAEFAARFAGSFVGASGTGATIHIRPGDAGRCEWDVGSILRAGGEEILIDGGTLGAPGGVPTAGYPIDKTNPNDWFVHVQRAYAGVDAGAGAAASGAAASHPNAAAVYDCAPWRTDRVHPNGYGHQLYCEMLYRAVNAAQFSVVQQARSGGYKTPSRRQGWRPTSWLYRRGSRTTRAMSQGDEWAHPILIPDDGVISAFAVFVTVPGALANYRFGLYGDGEGCPSFVLYDSLAAYGPGRLSANVAANSLAKILLPRWLPVKAGLHWLTVAAVDAGGTTIRGYNGSDPEYTIPGNDVRIGAASEPIALQRSGIGTSALTAWSAGSQFAETNGYTYITASAPLAFALFRSPKTDF